MRAQCVTFQLPDGRRATAGAGATLGRSTRAAIRLQHAGVAAWHARVATGGEALVLRALDGPIAGARKGIAPLHPGGTLQIGGATLLVVQLGTPPETALWLDDGQISLRAAGDDWTRTLSGLPARIGARLLSGSVPWEALAAELWPDDASIRGTSCWTPDDERRYRNRFDQQLAVLRAFAGDLRPDGVVRVTDGVAALAP